MKLVECNIHLFKNNYQDCVDIINKIIGNTPSHSVELSRPLSERAAPPPAA